MSNELTAPETTAPSGTAGTAGMQRTVALAFRAAALIEAITWVALLIAMAFKYVISDNETGVQIVGPIHGVAFIAYVVTTTLAARTFRWSFWLWVLGLAASIPPVATALFEQLVARRGRLSS